MKNRRSLATIGMTIFTSKIGERLGVQLGMTRPEAAIFCNLS
jgi:hypothetical protein